MIISDISLRRFINWWNDTIVCRIYILKFLWHFFFTFQDMHKLNGMFAYHLQVALIHQKVWDAFLDLFTAWKMKKLKDKETGTWWRTILRAWRRERSQLRSEEQELLIRSLIEGKVSINEFRKGIPPEVSRWVFFFQ